MVDDRIRDFWEENPCGEHHVVGDGSGPDDPAAFFFTYDRLRYATQRHLLKNFDALDFRGKRVLEIGIGQGSDAQQMIDRGAHYYGVDLTAESCRRAVLRFGIFRKPYKAVVQANATALPFKDKSFDIIYSHGALHHIPEIRKAAGEFSRVLAGDGKVIIMLYARRSLNYYVSILFLRRVLFIGLYVLDRLTAGRLIKRRVFRKHISNASAIGLRRYLSKDTFLSRNTDGPDNPYSRVYSRSEVAAVFNAFSFFRFDQYFLNERQLIIFKIVPEFLKRPLAKIFGWHLWCVGGKR